MASLQYPEFPHRSRARETMDDRDASGSLVLDEYRYLAKLNRVGRTAELALHEVRRRTPPAAGSTVRIVDFGSGGGDVPRRMVQLAPSLGFRVEAVASDLSDVSRQHLGTARPAIEFVAADVRDAASAFPRQSVDVAHASLVLHHLSDQDVVSAIRSMAAVSRQLVLWNDLIRDGVGEAGAFLASILSKREIRRDAVTSVRRGFRVSEARAAAEAAGLVDIEVRRVRMGRFLLSGRPGSPPAARPTVRATGLRVGFGSRLVLDGLSFAATAGEIVVVRGPNGSGKSTLLSCLAGAIRVDSGHVWTDGGLGPIGFHPQSGGLVLELDARANVGFFAGLGGLRGVGLDAATTAELVSWGLMEATDRPITHLSGGLQRRAALASCFVHGPRLVVLDEPDAGLDAAGRAELARRIRSVRDAGGTAVIASHSPDWVEREFPEATIFRLDA